MPDFPKPSCLMLCLAVALAACSDLRAPATADVAVASAAVDDALKAGAAEPAPLELRSARDKLKQAEAALAVRDYQRADLLARQSLADAKLAQGKANTAKAQATVKAMQGDIEVLQEQIRRKDSQ